MFGGLKKPKLQNRKQAERKACRIQACPKDMEQESHFMEIIDLHVLEISMQQKHATDEHCDPYFRARLRILSSDVVIVM